MGKSYRELGFWSNGLGFSESINENAIYSSSMKELGQVFWPGGPWYTPRGWTLPTSAKPLRIGVPVGSIFKQTASLPLPYNFFPFNGTYNALVEQIHLKNFDAVVGDIAVMAKQHRHAEFTHPYTESGLVMVVPVQSKAPDRAWLFVKLFTKAMWVLIVTINVNNGFVICASMLTFQQLEPTIADVEALQNSNAMVGHRNGSFVSEYLADVLHFKPDNIKAFTSPKDYAQALRSKEIATAFLEYPLAKLFLAKYCKGFTLSGPTYKFGGFGFVILLLLSFAFLFIKTSKTKTVLPEYGEMVLPPLTFMAFPRQSQLLPSITAALLKVAESGKLQELENNMIASEKCKDVEPENGSRSLSPNSFLVLFILTGGTSTIATIFKKS
ncbi:hypothetical protein RGQ29_027507 [Quercus rubra]|uniref:Ionotropic glutamate receptor C-terminal domain-containing protein n=1 Tax=Quercus rubra TaxID=3512 RepID=A0AAN7EPC0_QUERU|nr:hypothetical protein RGQ29_027507 [Quercus rubra]